MKIDRISFVLEMLKLFFKAWKNIQNRLYIGKITRPSIILSGEVLPLIIYILFGPLETVTK